MHRICSLALFLVLLGASSGATAAGLVHVRLTVFGMDCAPCAYGIEQGLKALPGAGAVTVSLNEGYAALGLAPGSTVSLEQIRQVVRNNGFTPKEASVQIEGMLQLSPAPALQAGTVSYALQLERPPGVAAGERVRVSGTIGEVASTVAVNTIAPAVSE